MIGAELMIFFSSFLCLYFLLVFINRVWWTPIRIQSRMRSQGIRGPSYKFIHGNTKEIINMRNESRSSPMGLSHQILSRINPHIYSWNKLHGPNCFLMWYGPQAQLVVSDPELIKEILMNNKVKAYTKRKPTEYPKKLLGDGLVTTTGEKWVKQRTLANQVFYTENLKSMIPTMISSVDMMMERWRDYEGKELEVYQEFKVLTSEVISRTGFGSSYLEGANMFNMLKKMIFIISRNEYKVKIPGISKFVKTSDDVESDKLVQDIRDSVTKILKKRESNLKKGEVNSYENDLLGGLMNAYHSMDEAQKITLDDLVDECKTFYVAGYETTANLLSWTVLLLAIQTDWQEKAREEVLEVFGRQSPRADAISRLKIMSMIINETLRLYPPAIQILRYVKEEAKLGKHIIPANVDIIISVLAVHHDPRIWGDDVHHFKPKRFAEGVAKATNNMAAFLPFGLGPRTCVGMNFAITEAKIALSMILQRYSFTLSPAYVHSPVQLLTLTPQHGVQVMIHGL